MTTAKKTAAPAFPSVTDMSCEAIDCKPIDQDWHQGKIDLDGDGDGWSFVESVKCEKCGAVLALTNGLGGGEKHSDVDGDSECDGYVPSVEGPMMSYYYPLDIDDTEEAARKLVDTCLCVVTVDGGQTGLALTGGGQDLSWNICEAFMFLGCLPPAHFADLPSISGRGTSERDLWIASGCIRSLQVLASWSTGRIKRIKRTLEQAHRDAAKKGKR